MIQSLCNVKDWVCSKYRNVALGVAFFGLFAFQSLQAQTFYGISGADLVTFDAATPGMVTTVAAISGVDPLKTIVGVDFRPLTGQLYGLGYDAGSGNARLYTIDLSTANATSIGAVDFSLDAGETSFGFDFNPTVDRIRLITGFNQKNYRLHPVTGVIVATDGNINVITGAGDPNEGNTVSICGSAYTNSYAGSPSTTLYNIDVNGTVNSLFTQVPPNNGTLNTIGSLGITAVGTLPDRTGFDIGAGNAAFLHTVTALGDELFSVDLTTGAASSIGVFTVSMTDIAAQIVVNNPTAVAGQLVYAITNTNQLITFDSDMPSTIRSQVSITGVTAGQSIVGLDTRPSTAQLYAFGYNSTSGEAQVYTMNKATGAVTAVGTSVTVATGMTGVTMDFNPTVDRIRVTARTGQNFRFHPTTGALVITDGSLNYAAGDANFGTTPNVVAGAYTNSFIGSTGTTLFNYDIDLNIVTSQNPPNSGTLNTIGLSTITLNPAGGGVDMDFYFDTLTGTNKNFLIGSEVGLNDNVYTLDLTTGAATLVGQIGNGIQVQTAAVESGLNIPTAVSGEIVYGLTQNGQWLIQFDSENPTVVRAHTQVSGVTAGQSLVGMDVRPATGELYALGYNSTNGETQLYVLDPSTAVATTVGATSTLAASLGNVGMDFNPTVDRIRVISSSGMNYRLHPVTGALAFTDGTLAYATGDANEGVTPAIGSGAYTNSFGGSNNTVLYDYDDALNVISRQVPPNNGTLNTVGSSTLTQSTTDATSDMDIYYDHVAHTNTAYLISNAGVGTATNDNLYTVNLSTGVATLVGTVGNGIALRDIAVRNATITAAPNTSSAATISPTVCDTYMAPNGVTYTTSGTYTAIIPNAAGYDSLITINLTVNTTVTSTFNAIAAFCEGTTPVPALDAASIEGITGTWNPATIDNTISGTYTFTPDAGQCGTTAELMVTVTPRVTPTFDPIGTICQGTTAPTLVVPSNEGINGTWSPSVVDNTTSGTYTFTPDASECATTTTLDVVVSSTLVASTFDPIAAICAGDAAPTLVTPSNEGFTGTWSPSVVDNTTSGTYTFTPDAGQCAESATLDIVVNAIVTPSFSVPSVICAGDAATILPTTSNEGVIGTWNPTTVDNSNTGNYTFTPDAGQCATSLDLTITVNPAILPLFDPIDAICEGATAPVLPTSSLENITGTWAPTTVDNMVSGTYTFTPDAGQCATTTSINVTVNPIVTTTFNPIAAICAGDVAPVLPATSNEGIAGSWMPTTVDNMNTGTYTFTPDAGQCGTTATIVVTVNAKTVSTFNPIAPICAGDAAPVLQNPSNESITGTWTPATVSNTTTGTYTFTPAAGQCATSATITVTVNATGTPTFTAIPAFCAGTTPVPTLPAMSNQGTAGTWNPAVINNTATGTYTFTPTSGGCATTATLTVTVTPKVTPTFAAIVPICAGSTPAPTLSATSTNSPSIAGSWSPATVNVNATGTYTFTPNGSICASTTTLVVTVKPKPTVTASSNTPVCVGKKILLTASTVAGASYSWSGPKAFASTIQNPEIAGVTIDNGGVYKVTTTLNGCTAEATTVVAVGGCLGVDEFSETAFTVYPNPTSGSFTVELVGAANNTIQIFDGVGRLVNVTAVTGSQTTVDLSSLMNGVYIVKIGTETRQVVKQ